MYVNRIRRALKRSCDLKADDYSRDSGWRAMFFSPAAFFSFQAFTQSSQCLPAAL